MRSKAPPDEVGLRGLTIYDLKAEAHDLIDHLVFHGRHRNQVYAELRYRLNVPEGYEHIGKMAAMSQVQKAIVVLKEMRREQKVAARERKRAREKLEREKNPPPPSEKSIYKKIAPAAVVKVELAKAMEINRKRRERDAEIEKELERYPLLVRPIVRFFGYNKESED